MWVFGTTPLYNHANHTSHTQVYDLQSLVIKMFKPPIGAHQFQGISTAIERSTVKDRIGRYRSILMLVKQHTTVIPYTLICKSTYFIGY